MGNRALRKQASQILGLSIYKGSKLRKYTLLKARDLHRLINDASYNVGDIIYDCSGYNRKIAKKEIKIAKDINGHYVYDVEIIFDDNSYRCDCTWVHPALPKELVQNKILSWITFCKEEMSDWADTPFYREVQRRHENGEEFLDENGCVLPDVLKVG